MQPKLDLDTYARLLAKFAHDNEAREALLATHRLSEEAWSELDEYWQDQLIGEDAEDGELSPLLARFSDVFTETQRQLSQSALDLDTYAEILRQVQSGRELNKVLSEQRTSLATYLQAHAHWTRTSLDDETVQESLHAKLNEPQSSRRRTEA